MGQIAPAVPAAALEAADYAAFKSALESSGCRACGLAESRTRIVVDRGNPQAEILVVGEAPGENEDRQGRVFVGRAGQLFDGLLGSVGLHAELDTLLVNVVKCRPPDNRQPAPGEAAACRPLLLKQFSLVRARWCLLLGATALKRFFPDYKGGLRDWVGQFRRSPDFPEVQFFPIFHPAYLLRDPRKKPQVLEWLKQFKTRLDEDQRK